jgi:STE24 endopeptidase
VDLNQTEDVALKIREAAEAYLSRVPSEQLERTASFIAGNNWIQLWSFVLVIVISYIVLWSGLSEKIQREVSGLTRHSFLQDALYAAIYLLIVGVSTFPLTVYTDFFRQHSYGYSKESFGIWFLQFLISGAVVIAVGSLFAAAIYAMIRRFQRTWWAWATAITFTFILITAIIFPILILPMIEDLKPLESGPIREEILLMAESRNIDVSEIYLIEESKRSSGINAAAGGFFGKMGIYLNDNLIQRCPLEEIRAVIAHEIGHYALGHSIRNLLLSTILFALGFIFTQVGSKFILSKFGAVWRIQNLKEIATLPLLFSIFSAFLFLSIPLRNSIQRTAEREADKFSLELSEEADGLAEVALKFAEHRKLSPSKVEEIIFFDHPSPRSRIQMAMEWKFRKRTE